MKTRVSSGFEGRWEAGAQDRRTFLKSSSALAGFLLWPGTSLLRGAEPFVPAPLKKKPALIRGAFFYPKAEDVLAGKCEDSWSGHEWFTWPGNQFKPEEQQAKFLAKVREMTAGLDLDVALDEKPLCTEAGVAEFIAGLEKSKPEALLLFNFWNTFSQKLKPILDAYQGPIIVYHPVGANHQLPPAFFREAPRVQYIHSIENWEALERGLRSIHAWTGMAQGRVLRVSGKATAQSSVAEPLFGTDLRTVPAEEFNALFDETEFTTEMGELAAAVRENARSVTELDEKAFRDALRAHAAVGKMMERHQADAITIECLMLKHRKPCLSFALNNGNLVPCGCENHLDATLTMLLGARFFGRGGFQHNPEFDTEQNLYFGAHCTCTSRLHGPGAPEAPYDLRPFFHQLPKTLALDVQWPAGEPVTICKYHSGKSQIDAWRGKLVSSPGCPPTGGCATRALVNVENVADVCEIYGGAHPVLYCGDFARHLKTFARLYGLEIRTNA